MRREQAESTGGKRLQSSQVKCDDQNSVSDTFIIGNDLHIDC